MKVIFDNIVYFLQQRGGGSVYWREITRDWTKSGEAFFLEPDLACKNINRGQIPATNLLTYPGVLFGVLRFLPVGVGLQDAFLFHSSYYRYSRNRRAVNITTVHDFVHEKYFRGVRKWLHSWQKKRAIKRSQGIICVSKNTYSDLREFCPWIDEKRVRIIENGVSDQYFPLNRQQAETLRIEDSLNVEDHAVLFVGHRTSYKNFDAAVSALALLDGRFHLLIVGDPLSRKEVTKLNLALPGRFRVYSGIRNDQLNYLYNQAYCLLYPSSYEGFGIPVLEAMRAGCPVVAVSASSIPEVAGEAAVLVSSPTADELASAIFSLEEEDRRNTLRERGFAQAAKYSWERTRNLTKEFYEETYRTSLGRSEEPR